MTDGHYRAIVAYLNYWTPLYPDLGIKLAMRDIGITDSCEDVILDLAKAGHDYNEETGQLRQILAQ